ncbi:MAG: DUF2188 domain-containing protein [Elusimicrobia bacterium]|nr:DUF2188 domain-containing protein [Candidatus Liberimonas magnetica]
MGKNIWVVHKGNNWAVRREEGNIVSNHRTQGAAIDAGKPIAKANQSELLIQGRDGKIVNRNTYGPNDPCPPKDKK